MFELRAEHMAGFQEASLEDFAYRAEEYLRSRWPIQAGNLGPEALRARVRECVGRAEKYGLEREEYIVGFVEATLVLGESFDIDLALAQEVLTHRDWSPGRRHFEIELLVRACPTKVTP
jgi:hypothetical protein